MVLCRCLGVRVCGCVLFAADVHSDFGCGGCGEDGAFSEQRVGWLCFFDEGMAGGWAEPGVFGVAVFFMGLCAGKAKRRGGMRALFFFCWRCSPQGNYGAHCRAMSFG